MANIRFQLDEHVPTAVAEALRLRQIDIVTSAEAGLRGASDVEHLARAAAEGRLRVTQDRDFLRLHRQGQQPAGIAYCKQGTRSIGQLVTSLLLIYEVLEPDEMVDKVEFL